MTFVTRLTLPRESSCSRDRAMRGGGLDYRNRRERPAIVYRNETGEPVEVVADDFDEFLGGLTEG